MEKYKYQTPVDSELIFGSFFGKVHLKHIESYTETGANNIVDNVVDTFKSIQTQINNNTMNNNTLLVGKVQSGKTSNLELLTALAFDNGYNILIIYGGYDKSLLSQTTERFKNTFDVVGDVDYDSSVPAVFTTDDSAQIMDINDEMMAEFMEIGKPIIFVSMKRPPAMKKINKLLSKLDKSEFKAFIIDDEGDQASLNTEKDKKNDSSATYKQIQSMKKHLNDPMYLSVTATPQANIFLDEWSDLRPDSIRLIQPGIGYTGADVYHMYENNIVEIVPDEDKNELTEGKMPESLWDAIRYFIVASAIKRFRAKNNYKDKYSDMIVHAFREVNQHGLLYSSICSFIKNMQDAFQYGDDEEKQIYFIELENCYNHFVDNSIKSVLCFDDIRKEIETVIKKTSVILKNGVGKATQSNEKLKWHKIYIGGDLLQRGLTFGNLITTYFVRWASSGGNMDVNTQRARWFGYREKYIDLCKVFTTELIASEFTTLADIENDLWNQFSDVENGLLSIDDILIKTDNTKQAPTNKQRVDYKKVSFKTRWIKQSHILLNKDEVNKNNSLIDDFIGLHTWEDSNVSSRNNEITCKYSEVDSKEITSIITALNAVFDNEPFKQDALRDLVSGSSIPVILMWYDDNNKERYRSLYPSTSKIKALQQGANSTIQEKITYEGDNNVVIDKDKINIQIHCIVPGYKGEMHMEDKKQYMFAIYVPKEKTYFVKG